MPELITRDLVALDADLGPDKDSVVRRLAALVAGAGRATSAEALHADPMAREAQAPTRLTRGGAARRRTARRDRPPALPVGGRPPGLPRLRPALPRRRLRRAGRAGYPRLP